jgi:N utilization substance protein B
MPLRQQPRRTARILALLSLSQAKGNPEKIQDQDQDINDLLLASIRTLTTEIEDILETASGELTRSNEQIFKSETRASSVNSSKIMLKEAIELTQKAINRLGAAIELPEFVQLANQSEVREYALELISTVYRRRLEIDEMLNKVMIDWQLSRLPQIDRNILRIAVAEMTFLGIHKKVAISEAVEIAKRYSDEDGYRFINGVLRKITENLPKEVIN